MLMDPGSRLIFDGTGTACLHDPRVSLARISDRYAGIEATPAAMTCPRALVRAKGGVGQAPRRVPEEPGSLVSGHLWSLSD